MEDQEAFVDEPDDDDRSSDDSSSYHDVVSDEDEVPFHDVVGENPDGGADAVEPLQGGSLEPASSHSYLGTMEELRGRTLLEEDSFAEIPIIAQRGLVCVPGQTLPLAVSHPHTISMLRRVIQGNHTFGVLSYRALSIDPNSPAKKSYPIGATAEIYEYGEQEDEGDLMGLRVKALVRQRFQVIQARRQLDGILVARVKILPEVILQDSLYHCRSTSLDKRRLSKPGESRPWAQKRLYDVQYGIPYSVWPSWVHQAYDLHLVDQQVRRALGQSILVDLGRQSGPSVPSDPVGLSYWVVQNLPLEDEQRLELLGINNANQRLRAELTLLQKCEFLCCRECDHPVARQTDVFAMSKEGPQGAYVNPLGHVHETLTVHRTDGLRTTTPPTTEFSWFPGYAWSIVECSFCRNHMGWLFTAAGSSRSTLEPASFWGLCRGSLKPRMRQEDTAVAGENNNNGVEMIM